MVKKIMHRRGEANACFMSLVRKSLLHPLPQDQLCQSSSGGTARETGEARVRVVLYESLAPLCGSTLEEALGESMPPHLRIRAFMVAEEHTGPWTSRVAWSVFGR